MKIKITLLYLLALVSPLFGQGWAIMDSIAGTSSYDFSGRGLAISGDGSTLAVGEPYNEEAGGYAGKIRIFKWDSNIKKWIPKGNPILGDYDCSNLGFSVALSNDGNTIAVGAPKFDCYGWSQPGDSIYVRVYTFNGTQWVQKGNTMEYEIKNREEVGFSVDISADGNNVILGRPRICGWITQNPTGGGVVVYTWNGTKWIQKGQRFISNNTCYEMGYHVAMSNDGNIIAMSVPGSDTTGNGSGHVMVYTWDNNQWKMLGDAFLGSTSGSRLGISFDLSADGKTIAMLEWINNQPKINVYYYYSQANIWIKKGTPITPPCSKYGDVKTIAMSDAGTRVAMLVYDCGDQLLVIYNWNNNNWVKDTAINTYMGSYTENTDERIVMNSDGSIIAISDPKYDSNGTADAGMVKVYKGSAVPAKIKYNYFTDVKLYPSVVKDKIYITTNKTYPQLKVIITSITGQKVFGECYLKIDKNFS